MADNVAITAGAGTTIATDQCGTDHYQKIKLTDGTTDSTTAIVAGGGVEASALRVTIASDSTGVVSIDDNGGVITVDGTVAVTNAGITSIDGKITACNTGAVVVASGTVTAITNITNPVAVTNAGITSIDGKITTCNTGAVVLAAGTAAIGKLAANSGVDIGDVDVTSVPAPLSTTGGGTEAAALRVTIANDSTGVVSIDDNGGVITVDGTVAVTNAGITSIDGKITACNTGAVVLASGTVTAVTGITNPVAVTNAGITSIDGKITACNTGAVVLAAGTAEMGKLAAGTALIGKVGIDQVTTNANEVVVKSITAGDNNIGNVDVASVAIGLTKSVASVNDWTAVAQNTIVEGTTVDVSVCYESYLLIQAFLDSTTTHTGTEFIIQTSSNTSGDEDWHDYTGFVDLVGTANVEAIVNSPLAAGATTINLASTTEYTTLGVWRAIEDGTLVNSELVFQNSVVTNNLITIIDGTTNEHAAAVNMYSVAMSKVPILLPIGNYRVRLLVNNTYDADGSTLNFKTRIIKVTKV